MSSSLLAVVVDCRDPRVQADFWSRVLGRARVERHTDEFLVSDPAGSATPLYFMRVSEPKVGKNRLHLDSVTDGAAGGRGQPAEGARCTAGRGSARSRLDGEPGHLGGAGGSRGPRVLREQHGDDKRLGLARHAVLGSQQRSLSRVEVLGLPSAVRQRPYGSWGALRRQVATAVG